MKEKASIVRIISIVGGLIGLVIGIFMLYYRPHESWYDDAYWADWAYQLSQGKYITNVWGGGQPSYSPLYALIMALWYKIVGFSYFTAQLPNLFFAFAAYLVACLCIEEGKWLKTKLGAVCFAFGYWVSDGLFGIFTCGRVETLCLLLGLLTLNSFFRAYRDYRKKDIVWFCVWSILQMATGFEGVLFTVVVILIHSLQNIRYSLRRWVLYLWYGLSSMFSFCAVVAFMAYHHCAKAFLRSLFDYSHTVHIIHFLRTDEIPFMDQVQFEKMTFWERIGGCLTVDGFFANKEYFVLLLFVLILGIIILCKKRLAELNHTERTMILSSIFLPWLFILAGRYPWYYTWVAYVPCLVSFCVLMERTHLEKILSPLICVGMTIWFCVSTDFQDRKRIDFHREVDAQNLRDIEAARIDPSESTYIPYKWYYYLATTNDKLYFEGSGRYPKDMRKLILSTPEEIERWSGLLDLEYMYSINGLKVYRVLGDK